MFGRIQQGPIWAQSCFGRSLIIDSISLTDIDLLRLSTSSCVSSQIASLKDSDHLT